MRSFHWIRTMPMVALMIAALAASAGGGCGDDGKKPQKQVNTGGTGGDGGTGGEGGGGTGGEEPPRPCEDNDDCDAGERCDEIEKICVPKCTRDRECGLNTGLRCDVENGGICVPGEPCNTSINCGSHRDFDYCKDRNCYCQEDETMQNGDPPRNGVCWRLAATCDQCDADEECGTNGTCRPYAYDGETRNVCLRLQKGACPEGLVPGEGEFKGLCVPQYGDCGRFKPCTSDEDCDQLNPVCDLSRQICIPGCNFNHFTNRSQGCPPQRVCHMTELGTDPRLLGDCTLGHSWGVGRCGPPCETDEHCAEHGPGFVCETYGTESRCVPPEAARKDDNGDRIGCMSDDECALNDPNKVERGYCDLATYTCVEDACRRGPDWRSGCAEPFEDCGSRHKCVVDPENDHPEQGMCVEKDCVDMMGADSGCPQGHFCVGEPYRDPFTGELSDEKFVEGPDGYLHGQCFPMNVDEWCVPCGSHEECGVMEGLTEADYPPVCMGMEGGDGNYCAPACNTAQDCPSSWSCEPFGTTPCRAEAPSFGLTTCRSDNDCPGSSKCVTPKVGGFDWPTPDNLPEEVKLCACDPDAANPCGGNAVCNAGIGTKTEDGPVLEHYCAEKDLCGSNGSCEFLGLIVPLDPMNPEGEWRHIFECVNDGGVLPGVKVDCPPGSFPGGNRGVRHKCVISQVCKPAPNNEGTCGLPVDEDDL